MILSLIAAIGNNNVIGKHNKLLWDMPADMKYFRTTTSGHPVIMGRKTFESIGQPLPKRRNVVITQNPHYSQAGMEVVHSLDEALALFQNSDEEVFCIGGGEIYRHAIEKADKLYITRIETEPEGDSYFPGISSDTWEEISRDHHDKDKENPFPYTFLIYKKKST
jgi:dihydrofolate reductase